MVTDTKIVSTEGETTRTLSIGTMNFDLEWL